MNVLVYSGPGTTADAVRHTLELLRRILLPYYAVVSVLGQLLRLEPWEHKTLLVVIPGGADLQFCKELNGVGNSKITKYVRGGGAFVGFCAGGYFALAKCEFEVGSDREVSGRRELGFFPGVCRGTAYSGFEYQQQTGARAVTLDVNVDAFAPGAVAPRLVHYYNGGGVFIDAHKQPNTTVLALYTEVTDVPAGSGAAAAVVLCQVGKGRAVLCGTHPEFTPDLMKPLQHTEPHYYALVQELRQNNEQRAQFLQQILVHLGLKTNQEAAGAVPRLTPLIVSTATPELATGLVRSLQEGVGIDASGLMHCAKDTFRVVTSGELQAPASLDAEEYEDPEEAIKILSVCGTQYPPHKETPFFNVAHFHAELQRQAARDNTTATLGTTLVYGEVLTLTNLLMDKNHSLMALLPHGFTITATTQVSGRGRGGNVWINPPGVLPNLVMLRLPLAVVKRAPLVFVQYLCTLAMVEAVCLYDAGQYRDMPMHIKWPNDLYIVKPEHVGRTGAKPNDDDRVVVKVGGTLVTSSVVGKDYIVIPGIGINVANAAPTTLLNLVLELLNQVRAAQGLPRLAPYTPEALLARYLVVLDQMYSRFLQQGFAPFLDMYYSRWLHSNQEVTLETHGGVRARIAGISADWGMLLADELNPDGSLRVGHRHELQPDGNSFDMFKGLISKKASV